MLIFDYVTKYSAEFESFTFSLDDIWRHVGLKPCDFWVKAGYIFIVELGFDYFKENRVVLKSVAIQPLSPLPLN